MATLVIRSNALQATDVLIPDLGFIIPSSGGSVTLITDEEILFAQQSDDLLEFLLDDAHTGSSTLILNDGTSDIAEADVSAFLATILLPDSSSNFGVVKNNASGEVAANVTFNGTATVSNFLAGTDVDLGSNKITNLAAGTASGDAVNKAQLDSVIAGSKAWKELVLSCAQLDSVNGAISQAIPFWLTAQPSDDDTFVISDGTTTETFTFQTTTAAAFDVEIGASVGITLANLAAEIEASSTLWSAVSRTTLTSLNPDVVVIFRTNNSSANSFDDRIYGSLTTQAFGQYVNYNGEADYSLSTPTALPSSDPTQKEFGFGRATANLVINETHICRDSDNVSTWNSDDSQWEITASNAFTFINGLVATAGTVAPDYGEAGDIAGLGSTTAAGVLNEFARADHVHTHGDRGADGSVSQHDADQIDVEGTYDQLSGTPQSLENTLSSINDNFSDGRYIGKVIGFGNSKKIPGSGVQYLEMGGVVTSAAGLRMMRAGQFTAASIQVSDTDSSRAYKLSIKINGTEVDTVALTTSTLGAVSTSLTGTFSAGDVLEVSVERTSGSGASSFKELQAMVEYMEAL